MFKLNVWKIYYSFSDSSDSQIFGKKMYPHQKKKKKKDRKAETDTHLSCSCEIYFDKITDFFLRLKDARGGEVLSIILTLVYYWCYSTDFGRIRNSQFHTGI